MSNPVLTEDMQKGAEQTEALDSPSNKKAWQQIPYAFASQYGVFISEDAQGQLQLCYKDSLQAAVLSEVRRYLQRSFHCKKLDDASFQNQLSLAFQRSSNEAQQAVDDIGADMDLSRLADQIPEAGDLMAAEHDAPVVRVINAILSQAVREKASDIHIETFETNLVVRFRVDGVLSEVLKPKRMLAPLLISRLKVMAKLDIAEKRVPQDGRISEIGRACVGKEGRSRRSQE